MPNLYSYPIFISHAWRYSDRYNRVIQFLDNAPRFKYRNCSVPENKAFIGLNNNQLAEQIRNQIRPASVVIIVSGMYFNHSEWLQFEIDFAKSLNKPILAIKPWSGKVVPVNIQNAANEIVSWNTDSIVNAIRRLGK